MAACEGVDELRTEPNRFVCREEVDEVTLHGPDGPTARIGRHEHVWEPTGYAEISFDCIGNVNRSGFTFTDTGSVDGQAVLQLHDETRVRLDSDTVIETGDDEFPCWEERGRWVGLSGRLDGATGTYCQTWNRLQLRLVLSPDDESSC